jgi:hypothetical protein
LVVPTCHDWWAEHCPDVAFLICSTGDPSYLQAEPPGLDIVDLSAPSPYAYKGAGHHSRVHPVADLFALAGCSVVICSPVSTFSHFTAHALGPEDVCFMPPPKTRSDNPQIGWLKMKQDDNTEWFAVAKETRELGVSAASPPPAPIDADWIRAW